VRRPSFPLFVLAFLLSEQLIFLVLELISLPLKVRVGGLQPTVLAAKFVELMCKTLTKLIQLTALIAGQFQRLSQSVAYTL